MCESPRDMHTEGNLAPRVPDVQGKALPDSATADPVHGADGGSRNGRAVSRRRKVRERVESTHLQVPTDRSGRYRCPLAMEMVRLELYGQVRQFRFEATGRSQSSDSLSAVCPL